MMQLLFAALLAAPAVYAQFKPFGQAAQAEAPALSFCAQGKMLVFTGDCSPSASNKDAISPKACSDVSAVLGSALPVLYPNTQLENYADLTPEEVMQALMRPNVLGFFFIGRGDTKGAFITGPEKGKVYPDVAACLSAFELFGGFTSHSRYSPALAAPAAARGKVLARTELVYGGAGAAPESWAKLCKPKWSLVYPTRTFAGRMKGDALKLSALLQEEKRKHVLKTLSAVCDNCPSHVAAGDELARLCPPNSDVCKLRKITPGSEEFILKNYCAALAPVTAR
jgi:hypothetical protein